MNDVAKAMRTTYRTHYQAPCGTGSDHEWSSLARYQLDIARIKGFSSCKEVVNGLNDQEGLLLIRWSFFMNFSLNWKQK